MNERNYIFGVQIGVFFKDSQYSATISLGLLFVLKFKHFLDQSELDFLVKFLIIHAINLFIVFAFHF